MKWLKEHAREYGVRDDQLFIGGESAGGGLAAALSLYARDKDEVKIAFQIPFYPMIDDRMITPSSKDNDAPVWNSSLNKWGWREYLGDLYETDNVPAYAAAARAEDYTNLPPTCTFVGTIEPFYDETKKYINNLKECGVEVWFKEFPGCFHAFDLVACETNIAKQAVDFYMNAFRYAVKHYFAPQKQYKII